MLLYSRVAMELQLATRIGILTSINQTLAPSQLKRQVHMHRVDPLCQDPLKVPCFRHISVEVEQQFRKTVALIMEGVQRVCQATSCMAPQAKCPLLLSHKMSLGATSQSHQLIHRLPHLESTKAKTSHQDCHTSTSSLKLEAYQPILESKAAI